MYPLGHVSNTQASSRLCAKLIQFDFIMGFNLRFLLPEDVLCVPCLFSDVLDGYGLCIDGPKCVTDIYTDIMNIN